MGQESSQLIGEHQDADGARIKPDPEEKENEDLRELSSWEGGGREEESLRISTTKVLEPRKKKKRRKRKALPFVEATQETLIASDEQVNGKRTSVAQDSQRNYRTEEAEGVATPNPYESANRKKAELEAKKRRLLAVAAAAAGGPTDLRSIADSDDYTSGQYEEHTSNTYAVPAKKAKKPQTAEFPSPNSARKQLTRPLSKVNLVRDSATNIEISKRSPIGQRQEYDPGGRARDQKKLPESYSRQVEDFQALKRRGRDNIGQTTSETRRKLQKQNEDMPYIDSSDEGVDTYASTSQRAPQEMPPPSPIGSYQGSTPNMHRKAVYPEHPKYDSDGSTPSSSSGVEGGNAVPSRIAPSNRTKETRILPPSIKNGLQGREKTIRSHFDEESMSMIDPSLWNIGVDSESRPLQKKLSKHFATPQSTGQLKHRLVEREGPFALDEESEPQRKKQRKLLDRLSTVKSTITKSRRDNARHESPELDGPLPTPQKKRGRGKGKKNTVPKQTTVTGRFSDEEFATINREMLRFRERYRMTIFEQNQMVQDVANTASDLWDAICLALPERSRQAIIKICRRRFHNFGVRGKWSKEDDRQLKEAYEEYPKSWKKISEILNRHPEDVRDRWRNYVVCGDKQKKEAWTEDEENSLRSVVAECVRDARRLKPDEVEKPDIEFVDWVVVSENLGHTRSRLQCITKWKQLVKMEDPDNEDAKELAFGDKSWRVANAKKDIKRFKREDYLELLLAIRNSQAGREGKVPWAKLGDVDLRTKWSCMTRKVAWRKLRDTVSGHREMRLQDIVTMLINDLPYDDDGLMGEEEDRSSPSLHNAMERPVRTAPIAPMFHEDEDRGGRRTPRERYLKAANVGSRDFGDPFTDRLDEDEFYPDGFDEIYTTPNDNLHDLNHTRGVVRKSLKEAHERGVYDDEEDDSVDESDQDRAMDDGHRYTAGSIDLDGPSQRRSSRSGAKRPRSPVIIKTEDDEMWTESGSEYSESAADSEEEFVDLDIPAKRCVEARRESVELGMG